jgi:hypothetical protein
VAVSAGPALTQDTKSGKEAIKGKIKKVDPTAHMLLVTLEGKKVPPDRQFQLPESTRFVFYSGSGKKEMSRKEAYANKELKEGARVSVFTDREGKAAEVRVGTPPRGK